MYRNEFDKNREKYALAFFILFTAPSFAAAVAIFWFRHVTW